MRILITLRATVDSVYNDTYHHKLRGRIGSALEGTTYDEQHENGLPTGLAFSNPFPPGDIKEGDTRRVIVASPHEDLLVEVAADVLENTEFNIGEMKFKVEDVVDIYPDVGEPGTRGVLETHTGVLIRMSDAFCEDHGIDPHPSGKTYWKPEHTLAPFIEAIERNAAFKHDLFHEEHLPSLEHFEEPLFASYEMLKDYWIPHTVTTGTTVDTYLSKWKLTYRVRDEHHRRQLNLLLDCGLAERNGHGFGFVNREKDVTRPSETAQGTPGRTDGGHRTRR